MSCIKTKKLIICLEFIIIGILLVGIVFIHKSNENLINMFCCKAFMLNKTATMEEKDRLERIELEKQRVAEEEAAKKAEEEKAAEEEVYYSSGWVSASTFMVQGVVYDNGIQYTWYSENVLPGYGLNIPGRHVNDDGYVCDGDGYICVASCDYSYGTVLDTPFGPAKVYDVCPTSGIVDVYVSW